MFYAEISDRSPEQFRRLTGVLPTTFEAMLRILRKASPNFGRPPKLSLADQVLLTLLYWREYRAQYHMAAEFGISEATCSRIIRRVENVLSESRQFRLPKRPMQGKDEAKELEVIVVDVTESRIQRPKKNRKSIIAGNAAITR